MFASVEERRQYHREWYRNNKDRAKAYYAANRDSYIRHAKAWISAVKPLSDAVLKEHKAANPCSCGESDTAVLGILGRDKLWSRAGTVLPGSLKRVLTDVTVQCLNCIKSRMVRVDAKPDEKRDWIREYKLLHGCARCGYKRSYAALDFHHVDPKTKKRDVSRMTDRSWTAIRAEILKCELLCANCHAKHHSPENKGVQS